MIETDLLVVGSGAAGFSAALTASHAGLGVLMVEKEPLFGGTTAYSAGVIWIPGNRHGRALGIADSKEDALAYLQQTTQVLGDAASPLAGLIKSGAARDHFLGFTAVSGRGEVFKSGGRVMKNVTRAWWRAS